ncbi:MAG: hypothetical protein GY769_11965 [bacterium]|nr:hypothetical protein [bacterium]
MDDSRHRRYKKRLQVRFWRQGDDNSHSGYTTNISMTGMFVATNTPVRPDERIKVEILGDDGGRVLYGEVVHAARVSPLLSKLRQAGMGIRLLGVDELVGELIGRDRGRLREEVEFRVHAPMRTGYEQPAGPGAAQSHSEPARSEEPLDTTPEDESEWVETVSPLDPTLFSIRFESGEEFLSAFRRELQHGGMFIKTHHPPGVDEEVTVEIKRPAEEPVRLPARVVSRRNPDSAVDSRNPPGINVDFKDLKSALEELNRLRDITQED